MPHDKSQQIKHFNTLFNFSKERALKFNHILILKYCRDIARDGLPEERPEAIESRVIRCQPDEISGNCLIFMCLHCVL